MCHPLAASLRAMGRIACDRAALVPDRPTSPVLRRPGLAFGRLRTGGTATAISAPGLAGLRLASARMSSTGFSAASAAIRCSRWCRSHAYEPHDARGRTRVPVPSTALLSERPLFGQQGLSLFLLAAITPTNTESITTPPPRHLATALGCLQPVQPPSCPAHPAR